MSGVTESLLTARGLRADLGGRRILDGIDLDVRAGTLLCLVGPNGAGKSTLLAALAGDLPLTAGTVRFGGVPVGALSGKDRARRRAVMVQRSEIGFGFMVQEVVAMGRAPWRGTAESVHDPDIVRGALTRAGVSELADRSIPTLSGGERARADFARGLAQTASVLLLDEPTAALDLGHQEQVMTVCQDYARSGCGVVVVSHDLDLAAAYADHIAVLQQGKIRAIGAPEQILTAPLLSEVYGAPVRVIPDPAGTGIIIRPEHRARNRAPAASTHSGNGRFGRSPSGEHQSKDNDEEQTES